MNKGRAKWIPPNLGSQQGFALVTAMMLLFVAMILGLMVVDSSDMEIMLSGAQQRYEEGLNTTEGGAGVEAAAVGTGATITIAAGSRSYAVVNPSIPDQVLSPDSPTGSMFDPGGDMGAPGSYTVDDQTRPDLWSMDNLLQSYLPADNRFDYHYRVIYRRADAPPKGYGASKFSGYLFEIGAQRDALVEMGGNKVGPKMSL